MILKKTGIDAEAVNTLQWENDLSVVSLAALTPDAIVKLGLTDHQQTLLKSAIVDCKIR